MRVTAHGTPTGWRLEVADDGPGLPASDRDRVFERFGTFSDAEGGGGTGLGLAIARWVTDLHGGSIHFAEPEPPNTGARVCVDLPHEPHQRIHASTQEPVMTNPVSSPAPPSPWPARRSACCWPPPWSSGTPTGSWSCACSPAVRSAWPGS